MSYQFDGVTKVITITAQTVMSVRDVYSRWADWLSTSDNAKYLPAFSTLGGDVIDPIAGTTVPIYAFLINGWKIRPQESSHTLSVNDGILLVQGGGDPFLNTLGNFVVRINYQQPVQAITVSTGGGSGGLSGAQATMLEELWRIHGLQVGSPLIVAQNLRTSGAINQVITESGATTTVERV
jgi:uncharacterized SAM-binding protein YcdF (DUF218 family)